MSVVRATGGRNIHGRVSCAATEFINTVGVHAKDGRVAIGADFHAPLEAMLSAHPGKILLQLIKIAIGAEDRSGGSVEALEQPVPVFDSRLRVVWRGEKWRAADVADGS